MSARVNPLSPNFLTKEKPMSFLKATLTAAFAASALLIASPADAAFMPGDLADLRAWYHAADAQTTGLTPAADGNLVVRLQDRSGNGIHLDQYTSTPTFSATGYNGGPAIQLDGGSTDSLFSTNNLGIGGTWYGDLPAARAQFTIFVSAVVSDTGNAYRHLAGWGNNATRQTVVVEIQTDADRFDGGFGYGDDKQTANDSMDSLYGTPVRFAFSFDGWDGVTAFPVNTAKLYYNGVSSEVASGSGFDVGIVNSPLYVGDSVALGFDPADALIQQIIIYNRQLSDAEILQVDAFLAAIPEPASLALLTLGSLLVAGRRR